MRYLGSWAVEIGWQLPRIEVGEICLRRPRRTWGCTADDEMRYVGAEDHTQVFCPEDGSSMFLCKLASPYQSTRYRTYGWKMWGGMRSKMQQKWEEWFSLVSNGDLETEEVKGWSREGNMSITPRWECCSHTHCPQTQRRREIFMEKKYLRQRKRLHLRKLWRATTLQVWEYEEVFCIDTCKATR